MKTFALAPIVGALWAASAIAASPSPASGELIRTVAYLEQHYPGQVVAIALDTSGDKPAHYHVDMQFPDAGTAFLDVDAATREITSHDHAGASYDGATLSEAAALAGSQLRGRVIAAQLDTSGVAAHYDVDVRLPQGDVARLKVDPQTRALGWRTPPVISN